MQAVASKDDFTYPSHEPRWLELGDGVKVCLVCGRFPGGVYWGRAPGQPRLDPDSEALYRREQAS